jgi:hypothetical protein
MAELGKVGGKDLITDWLAPKLGWQNERMNIYTLTAV